MSNEALRNLSNISQEMGKYPEYAQGGGGNTSVKLDKQRMAIKASGYLLSDVTEENGFSIVDYKAIREYLEQPDNDEDSFVSRIKSFVIETNNRPSIETGFHVLLGDYVIHTHSVYANILTCSKGGKQIASQLFPNALWVEYTTPGRDLTLLIRDSLKKLPHMPEIIFLQNHGVIITANTSNKALATHEYLNNRILEFLGIDKSLFASWKNIKDIDYVRENVLFPDQVVYTIAGKDSSMAAKQTITAYSFILGIIEQKGFTPNFLDKQYIDILLNMESEKHRIKIMKERQDNS